MINLIRIIYKKLREFFRINLPSTLLVNFNLLPVSKAIHLPIFCYGKMRLHHLRGRIVIDEPLKAGMIKIGYRWLDLWPVSYLPTQLSIIGTLKLSHSTIISGGVSITVQNKKAYMEFGNNVTIGGGTIVKAMKYISISNRTRITGGCSIMDSNMHYVKNIDTGIIMPYLGKVLIGGNCWINYGSIITKGAVIPDFSILARNSFVGQDYSEYGTNLFLVGSPAKVKRNNVQRIMDYTRQSEITRFFRLNPDASYFQDSTGIKDESEPFDLEE